MELRLLHNVVMYLRVFLCLMPVKFVQLNVSNGDHVTVGDVIQCSANTVNPPASYYWQQYVDYSWQHLQQHDDDNDDGDDGTVSLLILSTAGVYTLRCVAYNINNSMYNVTSDRVTLHVAEPGKCFRYMYVHYTL